MFEISPKNDLGNLKHDCLLDRMYSLLGKMQLMHGERPSLYHDYAKLGHYLKLHGSIDWLYCVNQTCGNHQLFFPNWIGSPQVHNQPGDLCSLCGSPLVSVIIPPTMHKSFENFPKLGFLWSLAYQELKQADKVIMIGISLAGSDYYLNRLIKSAIRASKKDSQIEVVNKWKKGDEKEAFKEREVCWKIERLTGIIPVYQGDFDEYLEKAKLGGV